MRGIREMALRGAGLLLAVLVGAGPVAVTTLAARPLTPAEKRYIPYDGELPACNDPWVLERIQSRFHDRETEFWKSGLEVAGFDDPGEIGFRTIGLDYIPRRYCQARALMNDQKVRVVSYSINEDLGIIGIGFGVEWCISGLDRHNAYSPDCKMARP